MVAGERNQPYLQPFWYHILSVALCVKEQEVEPSITPEPS